MKKDTLNIIYTQTGAEGLDQIADLWQKLRKYHKERAPEVFKDSFGKMTWETRKARLLEKSAKGSILVDLAKDKNILIGYCISTINADNQGEIESIYIETEYRRLHIGGKCMKTALAWMDSYKVTRKIIGVAVGNEEALGFYQKYGFYTRTHILQQADNR